MTTDESTQASTTPALFGRIELSWVAAVVLVAIVVHLGLPSQAFAFPTVSKTVTALLIGPLGLACLIESIRRRELPAILMAAFLASALVSGVFAASAVYSIRGDVTSWMTVMMYTVAAGWWALGRRLDAEAVRVLPWVFIALMALNAFIGLLQVGLDIRTGPLATIGGRAHGLLDNPVFYGTLWAGAFGWIVMQARHRPAGVWTIGVVAAAFATGLSGSRAATGAVLLAAVVALITVRTLASGLGLAAAMVGLYTSSIFAEQMTSSGTITRLASNPGSSFRADMWRAGLESVPRRPLFGHGFNHVSTAIDGELTLSFLRANQFDDLTNPTRVPHNFAILLLVSVGLVGTVLFGAWLIVALRGRIDAALLVASAAIAATWMLQPATQHSLPIAMLLVGAAVRPRHDLDTDEAAGDPPSWTPDPHRSMLIGGLVVGLLAAAYVGLGAYRLDVARDRSPDDMASAAAVFPRDAEVARAVSIAYESAAARGEGDLTELVESAIEWAETETSVAPSAQAFSRTARLHLALGDLPGARRALDAALSLQFWNPNARELLVSYAIEAGDDALLDEALDDACALDLEVCDERDD